MIHTTIGLYNNGSYKVNGVPTEDLDAHIKYNTVMRFGRALIVDGVCVHQGYLDKERIEKFIADHPDIKMDRDTAPYH